MIKKPNKVLVVTGEGIGNIIQIIPTIRTIKEILLYDVDLWISSSSYPIPSSLFKYINCCYSGSEIYSADVSNYTGFVSANWSYNYIKLLTNRGLICLSDFRPVSIKESEVDTYMYMARKLGVKDEDILWYGECNYTPVLEDYDVVIHDGFNRKSVVSSTWSLKSYPYYKDVSKELISMGYKVCSVGSCDEYIEGTIDKTGLDLMVTLGVIKNSKLFLGNDSGLYHCANALGTDNIVVFTFTSTIKNHDSRFHKYSTIIQNDSLSCLNCQNTSRFKSCTTRECRNIDPKIIINKVLERLNG